MRWVLQLVRYAMKDKISFSRDPDFQFIEPFQNPKESSVVITIYWLVDLFDYTFGRNSEAC